MALDFSKAHTFASDEQKDLYTEQESKEPSVKKKEITNEIGSSLKLDKAHTKASSVTTPRNDDELKKVDAQPSAPTGPTVPTGETEEDIAAQKAK